MNLNKSNKVINPKTGRPIIVGSAVYMKLISSGYDLGGESKSSTNKVLNEATGKYIDKYGKVFRTLINTNMYVFDEESNILREHKVEKVVPPIPIIELSDDNITPKSIGLDDITINKIVHIADVHIPLKLHYDRKDEYEVVFANIDKYLSSIYEPSKGCLVTVIAGDLQHIKLILEPETIILSRRFLEMLSKYGYVIIICGNHDLGEINLERTDSLTAICHGFDQHVNYFRLTGVYRVGHILFAVSSLADGKFIRYSDICNRGDHPIYKIYHGMVGTYFGNTSRCREITDFDGFDAVLLGDIHNHHYLRPNIAYSGSLVQRNFGEPIDDHGLIIWSPIDHTSKFIPIDNPYAFINLTINNGELDDESKEYLIKYSSKKMRIKCKLRNTDLHQYHTIEQWLRDSYNIHSIKTETVSAIRSSIESKHENLKLNDEMILIEDQLKDVSSEIVNDVKSLHKELYTIYSDDLICYHWDIIDLKFRNIFIYGNDHDNHINFKSGVNNICARNMAGKSSIINMIMFVIFGKFSHQTSQLVSILHTGTQNGYIEITLLCNDNHYVIRKECILQVRHNRSSSRFKTSFYRKNLKTLDFTNLNGTGELDTINIIRGYFGTFDIFVQHHLVSTKNGLSLLKLKPKERLEHFSQLFKTDQYENYIIQCKKKQNIIKKEYQEMNGRIDQLELQLSDLSIESIQASLLETNHGLKFCESEFQNKSSQLIDLENQYNSLLNDIHILKSKKIPIEQIGFTESELREKLDDVSSKIHEFDIDIINNSKGESCTSIQKRLNKIHPKCDHSVNIEDLKIKESSLIINDQNIKELKQQQWLLQNKLIPQIKNKLESLKNEVIDVQEVTIENTKEHLIILKHNGEAQLRLSKNLSCENDIISKLRTLQKDHELINYEQITNDDIVIEYKFKLMNSTSIIDIPDMSYSQLLLHINELIKTKKSIITEPNAPNITDDELTINRELSRLRTDTSARGLINVINILDNLCTDDNAIINHAQIIEIRDALKLFNPDKYQRMVALQNAIDRLNEIKHIQEENQKIIEHNKIIDTRIIQTKYTVMCKLVRDINIRRAYFEKQNMINKLEEQLIAIQQYAKIKSDLLIVNNQLNFIHQQEIRSQIEKHLNDINKYYEEEKKVNHQIKIIDEYTYIHDQIRYHTERNRLILCRQYLILEEMRNKLISQITQSQIIEQQLLITQEINQKSQTMKDIEIKIELLRPETSHLQKSLITFQKSQSTYQCYIDQYNQMIEQSKQINTKKLELEKQLNIYELYGKLFHRSAIPLAILMRKMTTFSQMVNRLFSTYTDYMFSFEPPTEHHTNLVFMVTKSNGCSIDPNQLSGFESVILNLAVNQTVINLTQKFRSSLIVIDESFDCIDARRFANKIGDILEELRRSYKTIILISHRDIDDMHCDHQLSIIQNNSYSTINNN